MSTGHLLGYFGKRLSKARRKLHEFVMEGVPVKLLGCLEGKRPPTVLSTENFREWVEYNFVDKELGRELQYISEKPRCLSEAQIQRILCDLSGKKWRAICEPTGFEAKEHRRMAVWAYRWYLGKSYREISERFSLNLSKISRTVNEVDKVSKTDTLWKRFIAELEHEKVKT